MSEHKTKLRLFLIFFTIISFLVLFYVIFQYKIGEMSKSQGLFVTAISFMPTLLILVCYSLIIGETFAKGVKIVKTQNPKLYFLTFSFWCALLLLDVVYVLFRIFTLGGR